MKRRQFTLFFILLMAAFMTVQGAVPVQAQDPFITTWKTDNTGTTGPSQISIPITGTGYNFTVDWGDATTTDWQDGDDPADLTHTYLNTGAYAVKITGAFPRIDCYNNGNLTDAAKIISIDHWGDIGWETMTDAFRGASNLEVGEFTQHRYWASKMSITVQAVWGYG